MPFPRLVRRVCSLALGALCLVVRAHAQAPRALCAEPEVRWSFGPLAFESAPLLLEGHVLANGRDATGRRALVVLDASSGRVLSRTLFAATSELVPATSGARVALRSAAQRIDVLRLRAARLVSERSLTHASSLSAPQFLTSALGGGDDLLLRQGPELARYALERSAPRWTARVPGAFAGTPAARGRQVFGAWYDGTGAAHLARLDGESGEVQADVLLGRHRDGRVPEENEPVALFAGEHDVFLQLAHGLPSSGGGELAWVRVPLEGERFGEVTLHDYAAMPFTTDDGWVAPEHSGSGVRWLLARLVEGRERVIELAAPTHHAWLSACVTPAAGAGDVLYLGPCAADARTLQVLWKRAAAPRFAPVPALDGLLVIEGDQLRLLSSSGPVADPAERAVRELVTREERALGERLLQLGAQALRGNDAELAQGYALEAEGLGAGGRMLELLRGQLERAGAAPGTVAVDPRRRTALLGEEQAARAALPESLATAARAARDLGEKQALLAELFRHAPEHAGGLLELARLLPRGASVAPGEARAWLEFLALGGERPFELLDVPSGDTLRAEQQRLKGERESWRPDARGFQSERLLVVTAGARPDAVARTLRSGELVCDVLEELFGGARGAAGRLELVLYPTREEYLAHSGTDLGGLESVLGFTAGHFDLQSQVSRLFLPGEDEESSRLLAVSAHELTHHWLAVRSRFGPPRAEKSTPGFWIVEAIATWVEELELDVEQRSWRTRALRAPSLDSVRNARAGELLGWSALLSMPFEQYTRLETRATCTLSLDWQLGSQAPRGPMQLFYAQGAALAHYLYESDGGAHRALLFQAVEAFYAGKPLDVAQALGVSAEELGERVRGFARGVR